MNLAHRIATITATALLGLATATVPASATTGFSMNPTLTINTGDQRTVTASGTASCDGDGSTWASVEVRLEDAGQGPARGDSDAITCDGTSKTWTANLTVFQDHWYPQTGVTARVSFSQARVSYPSRPSPWIGQAALTLTVNLTN